MIRMTSGNATQNPAVPAGAASPPAAVVIDELVRRGFRVVADGPHVVLERDAVRCVVPGRDRVLPARVVRMIEFGLEPHLGQGWLAGRGPRVPRPGRHATVGDRTVHLLEAVVSRDGPLEPWCAFLADEFSVIGFGDGREDALRDLKRAASRWMDVDPADVVLVTPTVV